MADLGWNEEISESIDGRYGRLCFFRNDTTIGSALRRYGEWAENELQFLGCFVIPGATIFDVGAYIGTHTLAFAKMVGSAGTVYSFEPQAQSFRLLKENVRANGLLQVRAYNAAVGAETGQIKVPAMHPDQITNFGGLTINADTTGVPEKELAAVNVITIDSLAPDRCDMIKIDVEGIENEVIQGATETIKRFAPVIYAECNSIDAGSRTLDALRPFDYKIYLHIVRAFNEDNFKGTEENIFGESSEAAIVAVPARLEHEARVAAQIDAGWYEIVSVDDLAYGMLQKPQYFEEILRSGAAAKCGGVVWSVADYRALSESQQRLQSEQEQLRQALNDANTGRQETEAALRRAEEECERARESCQCIEEVLKSTSDESEKLRAEISRLQEERNRSISALKAENEKSRMLLDERHRSIDALQVENEQNRALLDERRRSIDALQAENERNRQLLGNMQSSIPPLKHKSRELKRIKKSNVYIVLKRIIESEMKLRDMIRDLKRRKWHKQKDAEYRQALSGTSATISGPGNRQVPPAQNNRIRLAQIGSGEPRLVSGRTRPLLVCMTHVAPFPPRAGNEYRIHQMLEWVRSIGWDVLLLVSQLPGEEIGEEDLKKLASAYDNVIIVKRNNLICHRVIHGDLLRILEALDGALIRDFSALLGEDDADRKDAQVLPIKRTFSPDILLEVLCALDRSGKPDVILINYGFMTRGLPLLRHEAVTIIDTHDVFSTKDEKVKKFGISDGLSISAEEERTLLEGADYVLAIQPEEADELRRIGVSAPVATVGVDMAKPPTIPQVAESPNILMVGSANDMNRKGLRDFLKFAWPIILESVPNAELHVVGSVGDTLSGSEHHVHRHGRVDNLDEYYQLARVVINPAVAGTGLKIKTLEAISRLRPIVLWPLGLEGVDIELREYCDRVTDWYAFAGAVCGILTDADRADRIANAREQIEFLLSPEHVYRELAKILERDDKPAA